MKIAPKIKSEISLIHDRLGSHSPPAVFKPQFVQCHTKKPEQSNRHTCSGFSLVIIITITFAAFSSCWTPLLLQNSRSQETAQCRWARRTKAPRSNEVCSYDRRDKHRPSRRTSRTSRLAASNWPHRSPRRYRIRTCAVILASQVHTTCDYPCAEAPPFQNPRQTDSPAMCCMYREAVFKEFLFCHRQTAPNPYFCSSSGVDTVKMPSTTLGLFFDVIL